MSANEFLTEPEKLRFFALYKSDIAPEDFLACDIITHKQVYFVKHITEIPHFVELITNNEISVCSNKTTTVIVMKKIAITLAIHDIDEVPDNFPKIGYLRAMRYHFHNPDWKHLTDDEIENDKKIFKDNFETKISREEDMKYFEIEKPVFV